MITPNAPTRKSTSSAVDVPAKLKASSLAGSWTMVEATNAPIKTTGQPSTHAHFTQEVFCDVTHLDRNSGRVLLPAAQGEQMKNRETEERV